MHFAYPSDVPEGTFYVWNEDIINWEEI